MSSIVVRFPDGSREFRYPEKVPNAGDVVWHDGESFRVIRVSEEDGQTTALVEPVSATVRTRLRSEEGAIRIGRSASG